MFGQLSGCQSLRELTDVLNAHYKKSYFLGFGQQPAQRSTLSLANTLRDYHVFEAFAQHMVHCAQRARIDTAFELKGRFYAFDSTTIDLCMTLFPWAKFRRHKSGIKLHTQLDITTSIPVFYHLTNAMVHDVNAMDLISYEPNATYVFDRGYCFYLPAKYIALLYKYRWKLELCFKWIKSHLRVKSFWGYSENAVRI